MVKHQEINAFWRVFLIDRSNMLTKPGGHVFQFVGVIPDLVKQAKVGGRKGRFVHFVDDIGNRITGLIAQINSGKAMQRQVNRSRPVALHTGELLHGGCATVRAEHRLAAHPVRAFLGDGALGQFISP